MEPPLSAPGGADKSGAKSGNSDSILPKPLLNLCENLQAAICRSGAKTLNLSVPLSDLYLSELFAT